jgi:serine/threonine-protein kinase
LSVKGAVKLIDFGLALAGDRSGDNTQPGVVKGKMAYLSPEVAVGCRPTAACDQFAAGSVLWEALTNRRLFEGATELEVYEKVSGAQIQPLRPLRRDAPKELIAAINTALAAHEKNRFPSCRDMAHRLAQVLQGVVHRRDLHERLAKAVITAREGLHLGHGSQAPGQDTTPALEPERRRREDSADGLWHWLPFFGGKSKKK